MTTSPIFFDKVVSTLPATLTPNTFYAVRNGVGYDLYLSDMTGTIAYKQNSSAGGAQNSNYSINVLLVGGGGSGGLSNAAGGGAGGVREFSIGNIASGFSYPILIGSGGASVTSAGSGLNGGNSIAFGVTALGGGAGGSDTTPAGNGGSGGGSNFNTTPGKSIGTQGKDGSNRAGGGAGLAGSGANGGNGILWIDGNYYAGGGSGYGGSAYGLPNSSAGNGVDATPNTGSGGAAWLGTTSGSGSGASGLCVVWYLGSQRGSGGNISTLTINNLAYTLHYFYSSANYIG